MGHRFFFGNANGYSSVAKGIYVGSLDFPPDCDFSGNTSVSFNWNEHFSNCRLHIQIVPFHGLVGVPEKFETFLWIIVFWDFWSFCTNFRWIGFWQFKTRAQQCKSVRLIVFGCHANKTHRFVWGFRPNVRFWNETVGDISPKRLVFKRILL